MGFSRWLKITAGAGLALGAVACGDDGGTDADGARFASPVDGDRVSGPVVAKMEADGIAIVPAAEPQTGEGHFHIIVDQGCLEPGEFIPLDAEADGYFHFGDASTSAELDLEPGERNLCLQVGDGAHTALDMTDEITVIVEG